MYEIKQSFYLIDNLMSTSPLAINVIFSGLFNFFVLPISCTSSFFMVYFWKVFSLSAHPWEVVHYFFPCPAFSRIMPSVCRLMFRHSLYSRCLYCFISSVLLLVYVFFLLFPKQISSIILIVFNSSFRLEQN